jgi:hypothetical protein
MFICGFLNFILYQPLRGVNRMHKDLLYLIYLRKHRTTIYFIVSNVVYLNVL